MPPARHEVMASTTPTQVSAQATRHDASGGDPPRDRQGGMLIQLHQLRGLHADHGQHRGQPPSQHQQQQ